MSTAPDHRREPERPRVDEPAGTPGADGRSRRLLASLAILLFQLAWIGLLVFGAVRLLS